MFDHLKLFKDMERLFNEQRKLFKSVFDHWDQPFFSLEDKKEEKPESKEEEKKCCCCTKKKRHSSILTDDERKRFRDKVKARTKCRLIKKQSDDSFSLFNRAVNRVEKEENYKKHVVENIDTYAARMFSLINRDDEWDDDIKALANVGIKIYFFAKLFLGGPKALDFYKYVLSTDPNFKKLLESKNDEKLGMYRDGVLAQLVKKDGDEKMYNCVDPIFKSSTCGTSGRSRECSNGNYNSKVVLNIDNFSLHVSSVKNGGSRDGWFVELRKGEDEFARVFNVSPSTKLADMVSFVRDIDNECECDEEDA